MKDFSGVFLNLLIYLFIVSHLIFAFNILAFDYYENLIPNRFLNALCSVTKAVPLRMEQGTLSHQAKVMQKCILQPG